MSDKRKNVYNPKEVESRYYKIWEERGYFEVDGKYRYSKRVERILVIMDWPPPNGLDQGPILTIIWGTNGPLTIFTNFFPREFSFVSRNLHGKKLARGFKEPFLGKGQGEGLGTQLGQGEFG